MIVIDNKGSQRLQAKTVLKITIIGSIKIKVSSKQGNSHEKSYIHMYTNRNSLKILPVVENCGVQVGIGRKGLSNNMVLNHGSEFLLFMNKLKYETRIRQPITTNYL